LGSLVRDSALDAVARDHAARMARAQDLAHELGDGNPLERLRAAGVDARYAGENAAHASTLALAHRSIWASPSHRANLLHRGFDRIGVAVVRDDRGDAWVVETLASD
ncbi:MAG: CAP domain-containing protein, partial [Myxococcota bacterium]|nr:CAP domain-containing protein [Myxococcota bacterium]